MKEHRGLRLAGRRAWAATALQRIACGASQVGIGRTARGLVNLALLHIRRPTHAAIMTADRRVKFDYEYPAQLMPLLVVFQEVVDPELEFAESLLQPGSVAVDVGASIGTWAVCAAKTGACVHAFEPDPQNFRVLERNVESNGLGRRVITHAVSLGEASGWARTSGHGRYQTNVILAQDAEASTGARIYSLQEYLARESVDYVDVLKVNTAGCESAVLAGCIELFREQKVRVAMFLDGIGIRPMLAQLKMFSYGLGFYDSRRACFVPVSSVDRLDAMRPSPLNRYVVVKRLDPPAR